MNGVISVEATLFAESLCISIATLPQVLAHGEAVQESLYIQFPYIDGRQYVGMESKACPWRYHEKLSFCEKHLDTIVHFYSLKYH